MSSDTDLDKSLNKFRKQQQKRDDLGKLLKILTDQGSNEDEGLRYRTKKEPAGGKYLPQVVERLEEEEDKQLIIAKKNV